MSADVRQSHPSFGSFLLAGFECASHRSSDGHRLDLIASTFHDTLVTLDYECASALGIRTVRDGVRWYLAEPRPATYVATSFLPAIHASRHTGVQVIWDLLHYGLPDHVGILSKSFPKRFASMASFFARTYRSETDLPLIVTPINEISYLTWLAQNRGLPAARIKQQLVRAYLAAVDELLIIDPLATFVTAEPLISVTASVRSPENLNAAIEAHDSQYEACDMITGRSHPELGGSPAYISVLGLDCYPWNQWLQPSYRGEACPPLQPGHPDYRPLNLLLHEVHSRYNKPLLISETSCEGPSRQLWLQHVCAEAAIAKAYNVPILGICWYPALDYPGFDDGRHCDCGIWGFPDGNGCRLIYQPLAAEWLEQEKRFRSG